MQLEGSTASEILKECVKEHGINSRLQCIIAFKEAFSLSLREASFVGAWHKFPGGTWSDEELNTELKISSVLSDSSNTQ